MKRSWLSWLAILAMLTMMFAVTGCSDDDDDNGGTGPIDTINVVTEYVIPVGDDYFANYGSLGVNTKASVVYSDPTQYTILDFRGEADFNYAHIVGAQNQSLATLVDDLQSIPTDKKILAVCYTGQTASIATSVINLLGEQTGHTATNLKFGMSGFAPQHAWSTTKTYPMDSMSMVEMAANAGMASPDKNAAGQIPSVEMASDTTALDALKVRAQVAIDAYISGAAKISAANADAATPDDLYLINYFTPANYLDGHLDGAILYTPSSSAAGTTCEFLSTEALNTLPLDKDIAVYCYTGQTSAQVVAYLQMAGYSRAKTVMFGTQHLCYDHCVSHGVPADDAINDVPFHGPETDGAPDDDKYIDALVGSFN